MTCKDIEDRLAAYQEGAVTPEEKALVEAHLSTCAKCSSVLADLKKTVDLLKNLPEVELPPWFTQKVMAQVREEAEHKDSLLKKLFYPFHVKIPIEVFATLFVVVLGLYVYKTTGSEMKVVQRPPPALVEITPKDEALKYGDDKAKIDTEGFHQKEPASQPPASGKSLHPCPSGTCPFPDKGEGYTGTCRCSLEGRAREKAFSGSSSARKD
jgi:hypothetical protein